jgi:hypothetical protein
MNKRKGTSQNPFTYWWNEFLFARYFEYESDLSPQDLAEALHNLAHKRQGWVWGLEKTTKITMHPNQKGMDFNVVSKRKRLLDPIGITTASTHGTALVDSATGQTIIEGSVKLGRFFHIFLLIYVAFMLAVYLPLLFSFWSSVSGGNVITLLSMVFPMLIIAGVFGGLWWRIYRDRNNLAELIETIVYIEKAKRSANQFSDNEDVEDDWLNDEDLPQANQKQL